MSKMSELKEMKSISTKMHKVEQYLEEALQFPHPQAREKALKTLHAGGKRVRPTLAIMTADILQSKTDIIPLAASLELVHMASLIHDDVVDQADTRRGQATINAETTNRYAVHVGDYVLAKAIEIISQQPNSNRLLKIMADLCVEMSLGEVEQLRSTFDVNQTIEDYYYRIDRKTALLMATSCQAAAVACNASEEDIELFYNIGYNLGMEFQIRDDILDMEQSAKKIGKPAGSDLLHGIMTMPTILALRKDFPEKAQLIDYINSHFPGGQPQVDEAIGWIKQYGGIRDSLEYAEDFLHKAEDGIARLEDSPQKAVLLSGVEFLRGRVN